MTKFDLRSTSMLIHVSQLGVALRISRIVNTFLHKILEKMSTTVCFSLTIGGPSFCFDQRHDLYGHARGKQRMNIQQLSNFLTKHMRVFPGNF